MESGQFGTGASLNIWETHKKIAGDGRYDIIVAIPAQVYWVVQACDEVRECRIQREDQGQGAKAQSQEQPVLTF